MPLVTLAAAIGVDGISAPAFTDILTSLQESFQSIYGSDVYLGADTQDGQLLAIFAKAVDDANQIAIAVYNSFDPYHSVGAGLSSIVKINGIARLIATKSSATLAIGGVVGAVITSGQARDQSGNLWDLPATVTIPGAGTINVTASAHEVGAIAAPANTIDNIATPQLGWQSVNNVGAALIGSPIESDAALRRRQSISVALPALTVLEATVAAVLQVPNVTQVRAYENDTGATDANGLPEHSISLIVLGGDPVLIATAIMKKKTPGCFTYGTTTESIVDAAGIAHSISFFVPTPIRIDVGLTVTALSGYTSATGDAIKQSIADYINALPIGQDIFIQRLSLPAQLFGGTGSELFELQGLVKASIHPAATATADIAIAFNARATSIVGDIGLTVV